MKKPGPVPGFFFFAMRCASDPPKGGGERVQPTDSEGASPYSRGEYAKAYFFLVHHILAAYTSGGFDTGTVSMRATLMLALLALPLAGHAADCSSLDTRAARPLQATVLEPISPELAAPSYRFGSGAVLSRAYDDAQSAEQVVLRLEIEKCQNVAMAAPAAGAVRANDPAAYVKQTEFDNTPYRFNMTQGGKRMTADDFDAWVKANGYTVGSRRVDPNAPVTPPAETAQPGEATPPPSE